MCLYYQITFLIRYADGNHGTGIELQEVLLHAVAEDHTVFRHMGYNLQRRFGGDLAEDHIGTGGGTRIGLPYSIEERGCRAVNGIA